MARTYTRDAKGRFASKGSSGVRGTKQSANKTEAMFGVMKANAKGTTKTKNSFMETVLSYLARQALKGAKKQKATDPTGLKAGAVAQLKQDYLKKSVKAPQKDPLDVKRPSERGVAKRSNEMLNDVSFGNKVPKTSKTPKPGRSTLKGLNKQLENTPLDIVKTQGGYSLVDRAKGKEVAKGKTLTSLVPHVKKAVKK